MKLKFLAICLFALNSVMAQVQTPALKAMFIYNFAAQTEWPESYRSGDFIIGILGSSPASSELEKLAQVKKIGSQKIVIKLFSSAAMMDKCHLLFIADGQSAKAGEVASNIGTSSTLIVSEGDGLCKKGSMINFFVKADKLGFEMSKSNMAKCNLKPTNYLEKLAVLVN